MTKTKFIPVESIERLYRTLVDLSPRDLKRAVEELKEILQRAQTIHKNADTKARQIWRRVAAEGRRADEAKN